MDCCIRSRQRVDSTVASRASNLARKKSTVQYLVMEYIRGDSNNLDARAKAWSKKLQLTGDRQIGGVGFGNFHVRNSSFYPMGRDPSLPAIERSFAPQLVQKKSILQPDTCASSLFVAPPSYSSFLSSLGWILHNVRHNFLPQ